MVVTGATCFEDLRLKRTADLLPAHPPEHYGCFREAALTLGLLDDGSLADATLEEAATVTSSSAAHLCRVFVMFLEDSGSCWQVFAAGFEKPLLC